MFVTDKIIYFAFPKCASEWLRNVYNLKWNDDHVDNDWDACDLNFCHVRPTRFLNELVYSNKDIFIFSIVRNTFERLVSSYEYGIRKNMEYAKKYDTFASFIENIHNSLEKDKNNWMSFQKNNPMAWMYMPVDLYFGKDLINKIHFYDIKDLSLIIKDLESKGKYASSDYNEIINANVYQKDLYSYYYNSDGSAINDSQGRKIIDLINNVFEYEINRWNYNLTIDYKNATN